MIFHAPATIAIEAAPCPLQPLRRAVFDRRKRRNSTTATATPGPSNKPTPCAAATSPPSIGDNVIEEIEDVGRREKNHWRSCCARVLEHLLKIEHYREATHEVLRRWVSEIKDFRRRNG